MAFENYNYSTDIKEEPPEDIEINVEPINYLDDNIEIKTEVEEYPQPTYFVQVPEYHQQVPYTYIQNPPPVNVWRPPPPPLTEVNSDRRRRTAVDIGKALISSICLGHIHLNLVRGWNAYFVKDPQRYQILISQMSVMNGMPEMKKQVFINTKLEVMFYCGTKLLNHVDLLHKKKIKSHMDVEKIVMDFDKYQFCRGSLKVLHNSLKNIRVFDNSIDKFRHKKCIYVHNRDVNICKMCKILLMKHRRLKQKTFVNFKYYKKLQDEIKQLKISNKKLRLNNIKLKKQISSLESNVNKGEILPS